MINSEAVAFGKKEKHFIKSSPFTAKVATTVIVHSIFIRANTIDTDTALHATTIEEALEFYKTNRTNTRELKTIKADDKTANNVLGSS